VGSSVGAEVGSSVGAEDGSPLGAEVGSSLGAEVGSAVGSPVGAEVGSAVGSPVGSPVAAVQRDRFATRSRWKLNKIGCIAKHFVHDTTFQAIQSKKKTGRRRGGVSTSNHDN
jgi:phage tail tape-measure protein